MTAISAPIVVASLGLGIGTLIASILPWRRRAAAVPDSGPGATGTASADGVAGAPVDIAAWLDLAASAAHFGTWRMGADLAMVWSEQIFDIAGLPRAVFPPSRQEALALFLAEDRAAILRALAAARTDGAAFELSARLRRPDTELRHVILRGIRRGDALLGVLVDVTEEKIAELQMREARQVALQANAALREMTTEDELTGLANRRQFDRSLVHEFKRALRSGAPLGLALIDLDQFDAFNRRYGQAAGDTCLREIGQALKAIPRRTGDLVARYGGEEFAVLLPLADDAGTERVASVMLAAVRALGIPDDASETGTLTASCGVAAFLGLQNMNNPLELVRRADQALAKAKTEGRDRLLRYEPALNADLADPYGTAAADLEHFIKSRS